MAKPTNVVLTGPEAGETARILTRRLVELGYDARPAGACEVVLSAVAEGPSAGERMTIEIDPNDTPDFAAEKVLDELAESGAISLETSGYSPEEEELVRRRLADLGYIE